MTKYFLLVSGCRHYRSYYQFARKMDKMIARFPRDDITIIEGGARGVDYLAFLYALRRGIKSLMFEADWDGQGKAAGFIRNSEMLAVATHCITFWDGKSPGTKHVIENVHRYPVSYRAQSIPPEDKSNGKQSKGNGSCRKFNGRALSKIRKRHHAARGFGSPK